MFQVVGHGTEWLSRREPGDRIDLIGPLGNNFTVFENSQPILVGGGIGIPPLVLLTGWLLTERKMKPGSITVFQGAKSCDGIVCEDLFRELGVSLHIATDDGSRGHPGLVTDLLHQHLQRLCAQHAVGCHEIPCIYACGPYPMLKAVADLSASHAVPCQISMESHMPCGYGVCMGCVIPTTEGYRRCCKEGPVFDSKNLILKS